MTTPYKPVTIFHDSLALLELVIQAAAGVWPGDGVVMASDIYDVADMLPAVTNVDNNGHQKLVGEGSEGVPDARYIVDWHMWLPNEPTGDQAANASAVLIIKCGSSALNVREIFSATCLGHGTIIDYGPPANDVFTEFDRAAMNGSVRITGRNVQVTLTTFGTSPPTDASFGAYLRPF